MDQFQEESIYSKYLNFLSRFSKYDTIQYFGSLYEHLEIQMPEMNLCLPKQTLKKRKVKGEVKGKGEDGMVKKSTLDTMDNFNTFLSKSISEINGRMYQSLENSREFDEIINPEEERGIREKEEEQEESEGKGCGEDEEVKQKLQRSLSEVINKSAQSEMKEETKREQNEGKQDQRQNQIEDVEVVQDKDNSENSQKQDEQEEQKQNKNEQNGYEGKNSELEQPDNNEAETIQPPIQIEQIQQTHQQHQQPISHQNNPIDLPTTQIPEQIPSLEAKQLNRCQSQTKLTKLPEPPTKLPFRMAKTSRTSSNLNLFQIQGQQKPVSVKKKNFSRMFIRKNSKSPPKELRSESVKKKKEKLLSNFFKSLNGEDQEKDAIGIE